MVRFTSLLPVLPAVLAQDHPAASKPYSDVGAVKHVHCTGHADQSGMQVVFSHKGFGTPMRFRAIDKATGDEQHCLHKDNPSAFTTPVIYNSGDLGKGETVTKDDPNDDLYVVKFDPYRCTNATPDPSDLTTYSVGITIVYVRGMVFQTDTGADKETYFEQYQFDASCTFENSYTVEADIAEVSVITDTAVFNEFDLSQAFSANFYKDAAYTEIYANQFQIDVSVSSMAHVLFESSNRKDPLLYYAPTKCVVGTENGTEKFVLHNTLDDDFFNQHKDGAAGSDTLSNVCGWNDLNQKLTIVDTTQGRLDDGKSAKSWQFDYLSFVLVEVDHSTNMADQPDPFGQYVLTCDVSLCHPNDSDSPCHRLVDYCTTHGTVAGTFQTVDSAVTSEADAQNA